MENKRRNLFLVGTGIILVIIVLVIVYHVSQREQYMTNDPLFGSFVIENRTVSQTSYPADFLLSVDVDIDVDINDPYLLKRAEENSVDLTKCWVYSYDEDKIFSAKKDDSRLLVYENGKVIGTFTYDSSKFLWIDYDKTYTAKWRGKSLELIRCLRGFIFRDDEF